MTTQSKRARRARRQEAVETRRVEGRAPGLSRGAVRTLAVAFLLSGSAGLIHEVVWTRRLGFLFGVSEMAVATVLAAFMGGLAIGSWWLGARPWSDGRRVYAWLEIGIGVAALLVPLALDLVEPLYGSLWRRTHLSFATFSVLRFVVAGAILLAPTIMMGATFPVLAAYARTRQGGRLSPAWLYTLNLVGAMLGVAAAGFLLLPALGMRATIALGALVNVGVGLWVLRLPAAPAGASAAPKAVVAPAASPAARRLLFGAAFLSGLVSLASQVAWTRVLSLIVGSTTYAFAAVLLVFLAALGIGSAFAAWRGGWAKDVVGDLALAHGVVALLMLVAIGWVDGLPYFYLRLYDWGPEAFSGSVARSLAAALVLLLPSVTAAGTLLPFALIALVPREARDTGAAVGRVYAVNTTGAIVGAVLAGFVLVPHMGTQRTLTGLALATAALGLGLALARLRPLWLVPAVGAMAVVAVGAAATHTPWNHRNLHVGVSEPGRSADAVLGDETTKLLYQREGPTASVVVYFSDNPEPEFRIRTLIINARANASDAISDLVTQVLLAHIPLLLAPRTDRVFIVGWGSGVTVGSATQTPVQHVTAVELEPAVVEASRLFAHVNHEPLGDPRVHLYEDDARHILLASTDTYDVIISEPPHPWVAGVANLFTRDFYALAARRLEPDGIFTQWLQAYQISWDAYRATVAAFQSVFPEVLVFRPPGSNDSLLVGSRRPLTLDLVAMERRFQDPRVRADLARIDVTRAEDVLAALYVGPDAVRELVHDVPINTDDNMLVEFRGARDMAGGAGSPEVLFAELERRSTPVEALLVDPAVLLGDHERLAAYAAARERGERDAGAYEAKAAVLGTGR